MKINKNFEIQYNIKKYITQSDTILYSIKLYYIIIPATCFGPICRPIFRLILRHVECTIDNVFNLCDLVLEELVKIIEYIILKNLKK
jgi:hypothetical protein